MAFSTPASSPPGASPFAFVESEGKFSSEVVSPHPVDSPSFEIRRVSRQLRFLDSEPHFRNDELETLGSRKLALRSRLVPSAKFVETERSGAQMRPLVRTALVAHDLTGCEGRKVPQTLFGNMTVVASPSQVLSFLGSGVISVLYRNSVRSGISNNGGKGRVPLRVHIRLGRKDDE